MSVNLVNLTDDCKMTSLKDIQGKDAEISLLGLGLDLVKNLIIRKYLVEATL